MKILHLSDIHIGKKGSSVDESEETKKMIRKISTHWGESDDKPIVIITGDIVDDGRKHQFAEANKLLKPLWAHGFHVLTAPGNHDYGWNGCHALAKKFKLFKQYLNGIRRVSYPDVFELEKEGLVVIGLNSMKAETGYFDGLLADGELGNPQLDELAEILEELRDHRDREYTIVIYLHHHPFLYPDDTLFDKTTEWLGHYLKDGADLMKIISGQVDALLFGHEHRHIDFAKDFPNDKLTEKYKIPVILSNGKSSDLTNPARLISIKGPQNLQAIDIDWNNLPQ